MPPEAATPGRQRATEAITGRCYCGACSVTARARPQVVAYCHCLDCRRWTGAPLPAFADFAEDAVTLAPGAQALSLTPGVARWSCPRCGSPLAARFDYLPGRIYLPLGVLDQAAELPPSLHGHVETALPWLHVADEAERVEGSARRQLLHGSTPDA